ncbi:hypothetical protein KR054_001225 [Drosophila jambulina]|nr:hypothetical protein KR054_001225 [Drosophila jambulina]
MATIVDNIVINVAGIQDVKRMEDLYNAKDTWHIGFKDTPPLQILFCKSHLYRLLVYDSQEFHKLLAFGTFCNHPDIPVLVNDMWLPWLNNRFCFDFSISLVNTLFFNFFICKENQPAIIRMIILEVFYNEHKVNYIIVVRPPGFSSKQYDAVGQFGKSYYPTNSTVAEMATAPSVIVIHRRDVMPVITFRKALPEDNDDIVEMIDSEDPRLRREHGDFYIAEHLLEMEGTKGSEEIIIAEFEEEITEGVKGGGLMWLSNSVDVEQLATSFHLERLGNLVKYTPGLKHGHFEYDVFSAENRSLKTLYTTSKMDELLADSEMHLDEKDHASKKVLIAKFTHIYDELRSARYYYYAYKDKLTIAFDLPEGESVRNSNRTQVLAQVSNAFLLKMFQLHPLVRPEYTFFALSAVFSAYPDLDYCVTMVPTTVAMSPCQRQLLQFFLQMYYRPNCTVEENVFVANRSTLFGEIRVLRMKSEDVDEIKHIISAQASRRYTNIPDAEEERTGVNNYTDEVLILFNQIVEDICDNSETDFSCFTIRCGHSKWHSDCPMVGFIIVRSFQGYEELCRLFMLPRDQFNTTYNRGEVLIFKLHPFFQMWSSTIFRTVALYNDYQEIYYINYFNGISLPNDLTYNMMPLEPRRMKKNHFARAIFRRRSSKTINLHGAEKTTSRLRVFCYNLMPTKHLGAEQSLLIVGFSEICRAFMRIIIFSWNTKDLNKFRKFNCLPLIDLTIVVPQGVVEAAYDCEFRCAYCGDGRNCYVNTGNDHPYVRDSTQRMDMRHWVRFIPGTLKRIDRQKQIVDLVDGCRLHYDKLLIMDDMKFGFEDSEFEGGHTPSNYVVNNYRLDRIIFYHKLRETVQSEVPYNIIVYGYGIAAYECLHFMVTHGCQTKNITYVQPHMMAGPEDQGNPCVDALLDPIVLEMLADLGVTIYVSTNYSRFHFSEGDYSIKRVEFITIPRKNKIILDCTLFVNYNFNNMSSSLENILADADIVMADRSIVVNTRFCTSDPNIYAAGKNISIVPLPNYQYLHTNPQECAEKVSAPWRAESLNWNLMKSHFQLAFELGMLKIVMQQRFIRPFLFTGMLPMGYHIVKIIQPKPLLIGQLPADFTENMTTYEDGDFVRIRLNLKMIVTEIVCVTKKEKRLYFLEYFCGKHAKLLNDMRNRFKAGWITNFLTFFQQPWTELIMHERFEDLQLKNRRVLLSMLLMSHRNSEIRISVEQEQMKKLEENVIDFVRTYREDFNHEFALPEDLDAEQNYEIFGRSSQ